MIVITNNKLVSELENDADKHTFVFEESFSYLQVLERTRDLVHKGHKLLTHPLSSSIKPNETPFKTVIVSKKTGELDLQSLQIIEDSIESTIKFLNISKPRNWSDRVLEDFRVIDHSLVRDIINKI